MRGNEKMEKRKDVKRKVESVTFLVEAVTYMEVNSTSPIVWAALQTGCTHQHAGSRSFLRTTAKEFKVASKYLGADSSLAAIDGMQQVTTSTLKECNIFCVATRSASPRSG